jgi:hypothetical protein
MLEPKEILEIRKKYGPIFSTDIKGQTVFFRELTFSEFDDIVAYQDLEGGSSIDSEDSIITTAVVYPENFNVDKDIHIEIIVGDIVDYLKKNCVDRWEDIFKKTEVKNEVNDIINHYVEDYSDLNNIKFWVCLELNDLEELKEFVPSHQDLLKNSQLKYSWIL